MHLILKRQSFADVFLNLNITAKSLSGKVVRDDGMFFRYRRR